MRHQIRTRQVLARDVDVHHQLVEAGRLSPPCSELARRLVDGPGRQRLNATGLFGQRDEDAGADDAARRVYPAREGLEAVQAVRLQIEQGLVGQRQLALADRVAQVGFQLQLVAQLLMQAV